MGHVVGLVPMGICMAGDAEVSRSCSCAFLSIAARPLSTDRIAHMSGTQGFALLVCVCESSDS